jgi:phage I-like protein
MPADAYCFLLDASARERIQIAKLGSYSDERYGDFAITAAEVRDWAANLAKLPGGRAPIDKDHLADKPGAARNTEAQGWITAVELDDGVPVATVEWTPKGREAIENKEYLFISPSYGPWTDEQGTTTANVLQGAALTNKPFLNMAPVVNLARAEFATLTAEPTGEAADSRASMPTISPKILDALGVAQDADEATALSAITELQAKPEQKSLEAQAADEGKVLLSREDHDKLKGDADKAGALTVRLDAIESERATEKFDAAFEKAKGEGRLDAKDETRELHKGIYDADPERSLKLLASLPVIVNTTAHGNGGHTADTGDVPAGVDADAFELDQRVQAHMASNPGTDYLKALDAVQKER